MTAPSRDFLANGPRRVLIAAAGPRTHKGQALRRRSAALLGGSAHALQQQDALMCEPEVLGDGRLISIAFSGEALKDDSELPHGTPNRAAPGLAGQAFDPVPNPPGPQQGERQNRERGRESALAFDVGEVTSKPLFRFDLSEKDPFPGDSEALGAAEDLGRRGGLGRSEGHRRRRIPIAQGQNRNWLSPKQREGAHADPVPPRFSMNQKRLPTKVIATRACLRERYPTIPT